MYGVGYRLLAAYSSTRKFPNFQETIWLNPPAYMYVRMYVCMYLYVYVFMYVCMVITYTCSRVWINRVRLSILLVVK